LVGWYRRGFTLSTFSRAGGSARDTKRLFARCSTANRWRSQQRGLLPTDHNLTYGCYGQRPPLKVNELGGLQQPKKEKKALPRATAGVGERVRLLPSTHTGLRTTGSKIRDSKGGWLPARPRTLFCSFFLFSKLSRKPWRWKPIVKPLDRPDPTTTSRVGGGRGRFFSTPVFRGGRGGAYSESEGEVVVHTVTVRGSPSPQRARPARSAREWSSPPPPRGGSTPTLFRESPLTEGGGGRRIVVTARRQQQQRPQNHPPPPPPMPPAMVRRPPARQNIVFPTHGSVFATGQVTGF